MPVVDVVNLNGEKVGQVELADAVFGAEINRHLLHEASRWYLNGLRSGTAKTKEKSEVSGAGRKLWRQKGTGRARVGSIRSPLWRMVARYMVRSRGAMRMRCRRRCCLGRCVRRSPRSWRKRS